MSSIPSNGRGPRLRRAAALVIGASAIVAGSVGQVRCRDDECRDHAETLRTLDGLGQVVGHLATSTNSTFTASARPEEVGWDSTRPAYVTYQSGQTWAGWSPSRVANTSA